VLINKTMDFKWIFILALLFGATIAIIEHIIKKRRINKHQKEMEELTNSISKIIKKLIAKLNNK